jgi:hypothetical protein
MAAIETVVLTVTSGYERRKEAHVKRLVEKGLEKISIQPVYFITQ